MLPVSLFRSVYVSNSEGYIVFELGHSKRVHTATAR